MELGYTRALIMIVEVKPFELVLDRSVALRLTIADWGPMLQDPEAQYLPTLCHSEWLQLQHSWSRWCSPRSFRTCSIEYAGQRISTPQSFPTVSGALLKFCVAEAPTQFLNVQSWFPHAERVAQVALQYHQRGVLFFRLVFHLQAHSSVNIEVIYQDIFDTSSYSCFAADSLHWTFIFDSPRAAR